MDNKKIETSIKLLKEQISEDQDDLSNESTCTHCRRKMDNLCTLLCGCLYCWDCIENHLDKDGQCCPGRSDNCRHQILKKGHNVLINQSVDSEISRIVVKYPGQSPPNIEDLFNSGPSPTETRSTLCPFTHIGCSPSHFAGHDLDQHLQTSNVFHSEILIGFISNLQSQLDSLKSEVENSKTENEQMKCEIEFLKKDSEEKQELICDLQMSDQEKTDQITSLLQYMHGSGDEPFSVMENNIGAAGDYWKKHIDLISRRMFSLNEKIGKIETTIDKLNYGEFVWMIDNFTEKIKQARKETNIEIYSDSFFTHKNGYKICLRVDPIGMNVGKRSHLAVYFCIVHGPFDDILPWPMKRRVTFGLVNQETAKIHISRTAKYDDHPDNFAWNRPTSDKKIGYGYHKFVEMDEILSIPGLCLGDRIFIICSVDP